MQRLLGIAFIVLSLVFCSFSLNDPYETLEVSRTASVADIKRNYKRLARQWHPDKNNDPSAEEKFIEINKAYELLIDPERRDRYDRHGTTDDTLNFHSGPDYSQFKRFDFDPFESFFNEGTFKFQFSFNQGSVFHKNTVTASMYENSIIPGSSTKPYLLLFYGDLCMPCLQAEPLWQRTMQELEPLGIGFVTMHAQREKAFARKIGINSLPYLVGIIDGHIVHYKERQLSLTDIVDFTRKLFPYKSVYSVDDTTAGDFLDGWLDNRVRVLIFSRAENVRLRYMLLAYQFRIHAAVGHVQIAQPRTSDICQKYNINNKVESLLVFNENLDSPIASLSMAELSPKTMRDVLEANKFLLLPRLSSQQMFDQLCPPEGTRLRMQLCVILVTKDTASHNPHRAFMRDFIRMEGFAREKIRFMFLYYEKQKEFVKALSLGEDTPEDPVLHIVILWRREQDRVRYQWLQSEWSFDNDQANTTKDELRDILERLTQTTEALPYDAVVATLADEHSHSLFTRIMNRLIMMGSVLRDNITQQEVLPAVSVILSVGFIIVIGYIMSYLVKLEEQKIQVKYRQQGKQPPGYKGKAEVKLNVHELRGETYNGLVRLLKPGCRTILLLLDAESKIKLLPQFYRIVYPYRRNKTLMFSFLMVEKNLEWYRRLLLQTLGEPRELNINPKNCIGTVLSLNGHRKYFCVYHAKHAEQTQDKKIATGAGEFLGLEDSSSETENSDVEAGNLLRRDDDDIDSLGSILFEEHLLDGLPNWLDRLFEGTTKRYYIQYWPENMK